MPNIWLKVFDGGGFRETLAERGGWKLEQNTVTGHARILNERGSVSPGVTGMNV